MSRKSIIVEIRKERERQIKKEGWTEDHDDWHEKGELSKAAGCYATRAFSPRHPFAPPTWPWCESFWKPKDPKRNLIRAAALIVAELESLERAAARAQKPGRG